MFEITLHPVVLMYYKANCFTQEVPVYPDLPCEVKVEGGDDERTEALDESQAEEKSEFLPPLPINKGFPCEVCHRSFSSKSYLRDHQAVHSGERSFSCLVSLTERWLRMISIMQ